MDKLFARYHERIYRLTLLAYGDERLAARATLKAFAGYAGSAGDAERRLVAGLVLARATRWRLRFSPAALARAGLDPLRGKALQRALAQARPAARHALGCRMLLGLVPAADGSQAAASGEAALIVELAIALGELPQSTDRLRASRIAAFMAGELDQAASLQVRGELLDDAGARNIREGLARTTATLLQIMPQLFDRAPPPWFLRRLEQPAQRGASAAQARLRLALVGIVALLIAAIPVLSELLRPPAPTPTAGNAAPLATATDTRTLLEQALRRLERPPTGNGYMLERYSAELGASRWSLERWYDLAPPYSLAVRVADADERLRFALTLNNEGQLQYRLRNRRELLGADYSLDSARRDQFLPILRQQPDTMGLNGGRPVYYSLDRFYLIMARNNNPIDLGATSYQGRAARLIVYRTERPYPPDPLVRPNQEASEPAPLPARVILTIDNDSLALLDVTVTPEGEGEQVADRPWRVELLERRASAPAEIFELPAASQRTTTELISPRLIDMPGDNLLSLDELLASSTTPIYLPSELPEPGHQIVLGPDGPNSQIIVHEGAYSLVAFFLGTGEQPLSEAPADAGAPQRAGAYYYYPMGEQEDLPGSSIAAVALREPRLIDMQIFLIHEYASSEEREQMLRAMIASLEPLTAERVSELNH